MSGEQVSHLKALIRVLGRTERYVLLLFYADELTPIEIGLVLDLPESRVWSILDSLRDQLGAVLRPDTKAQGNYKAM